MGHSFLRSSGKWSVVIGLGVVLAFSACGSGSESKTAQGKTAQGKEVKSASGKPVNITNFMFEPQTVEVPVGTEVTWTNKDDAAHNVQDLSELNTPISSDLNKGDTFSITYSKPGTYPYVCGLHTYMTGTVKVT